MKSCSVLLSLFLLLFVVIGSCLVFYPIGYIYATYENLYGEWLQFAAFAGIAIFCFRIVKKKRAKRNWFWVLLGLAAFYTAMEEISWGQQIFGWKSWDFFQKNNLQGETNLHNMLTGPYSTLKKDLLTYALSIGMILYGVAYPVMLKMNIGLAQFGQRLGVPNPGFCLMPFFILAAICEMSFFHFNEAELAELFVALAMCLVAVGVYYGNEDGDTSASPESESADKRIAKRSVIVVGVALIVSFVMTQISINSSSSERRVANRIEAGIKKFASRYARVGAWDHSIDLSKRHLALDPDSRSRMRRLAKTYERAGRMQEHKDLLQQSLTLDLKQLKEDPWRASLHRSLFRTYKELGDLTKANEHIQQALKINLTRIKDHPDGAAAAYSMARTLELLGRRKDATEQYKRAFELKPGSSTYRRAYRDAVE